MYQVGLIALYLVAIISANLSVATFGPDAAIINAFLFIGLDLTTRDRLQWSWGDDKGRWYKMGALIITGSLLSWFIDRGAGQIAFASAISFFVTNWSDAFVFRALRRYSWLIRANGANLPAAALDSLLFPTLAFGGVMPLISLGQFVAKVAGGAVWSYILSFKLQPAKNSFLK